jgi:POT family proton-dependent oligopeptide transporter
MMLVACIAFFIAFEQAGSSLTLFAEKAVDRNWLGFEIPVSYFQSINPFFVITLAPFFAWLWVKLAKMKREPSMMTKMSGGLAVAGLGYLIIYFISTANATAIHFGWLVVLFLFLTIAELCISPVAISAVTKFAPEGRTSMYMGIWFGGVFIANVSAGYLSTFYQGGWQAVYIAAPLICFGIALPFLEKQFRNKSVSYRDVH